MTEHEETVAAIRREMAAIQLTRKAGESGQEMKYYTLGQRLVRLGAMTQLRRKYRA